MPEWDETPSFIDAPLMSTWQNIALRARGPMPMKQQQTVTIGGAPGHDGGKKDNKKTSADTDGDRRIIEAREPSV